jgi:hypothetical protein
MSIQPSTAEGDHRPEQASSALSLAMERIKILYNFYQAERRAGACPLVANERMHEFAKRLDTNNQAT